MKFLDKQSGQVKTAIAVEVNEDVARVTFSEGGKQYVYRRSRIEILEEEPPFLVYHLRQNCYKCGKETSVYTYIVFADSTGESAVYPWDKERMLEGQDIFSHLKDPSIEYYGVEVIGDREPLDEILAERFPDKIQVRYSATQNRRYFMNLCQHCGAKQGQYFIYRRINERIKAMEPIEVVR